MKRLFFGVLALIPLVLSMAGCGDSGGVATDSTPSAKAVLRISLAGAAVPLAGAAVKVTLPAGVSVTASETGVANGVVAVSGIAVPGTVGPSVYVPASGAARATIAIVVSSNLAAGFGNGEFATVTCNLATGARPVADDFLLTELNASDLFLQPVSGVTASLQVVLP
ncbi:hypothetical protein GMLC_19410 [Geomonas limicola]|uniref:Lipoprotein n=1 Tax=Geomonas limicola TaxID=2740186 RepID=A0A6V8N6Z6_9BACT|nr:hypothetical protein [Geomonas limicola]GFO68362.1 hypothetical protein GMLC_19410 [Geomonas limicola]